MTKKVPHFKAETTIKRATSTKALCDMLRAVAARHGFTIRIPELGNARPDKRLGPIMAGIDELDGSQRNRVMRELFWLNRIGATPEVSTSMYQFVKENGTDVPPMVMNAPFQDAVAWCYPKMAQDKWEQLITVTNFHRIGSGDWTQFVLGGLDGDLEIDASEPGRTRIRESVCSSLNRLCGLAEDGDCIHYREPGDDCDYLRLDILGYAENKAILVKRHTFRRRSYKDTVEVDVQYSRRAGTLSVCSGLGMAIDRSIAQAVLVGVLGEERAHGVTLQRPNGDTYDLGFIKRRSGNLAVPEHSILTGARVFSANTRKFGRNQKTNSLSSSDESEDMHDLLMNSWNSLHWAPEDFDVTQLKIAFSYLQPDGTTGTLKCRFSKLQSNYLDAPDDLRSAIQDLLIREGILNVAA